MLVLEKAFAKLCGSYAALDGGLTLWALHVMTGDHVFTLSRDEVCTRVWLLTLHAPSLHSCICMGVTCTTSSRRHKDAPRNRSLVITPGGRRVEAPRHADAADGR